jgi:thiol-disulfide isomerase/thioredoxin
MRKIALTAAAVCLMGSVFARAGDVAPPATAPATAPAADALTAEDMAAQIDAMRPPAVDRAKLSDPEYRNHALADIQAFNAKKQALMETFLEQYPDHPKAGQYLLGTIMTMTGPVPGAREKIDAFLAAHPKTPVREALLTARTAAVFRDRAAAQADKSAAVDKLASEYPAAPLLDPLRIGLIREDQSLSDADKTARLEKLVADAGNRKSPALDQLKSQLDRGKNLGQPFVLAFTDAATGKAIDLQKDMKGKILVIDFWATWCGPCVAEMPNMKKLYAEYHGQGVEFIGVSLDAPEADHGKEKLLEFVKKNEIPWPQYYQGNGWGSDFSKGWGIDSIPQMFVVDGDGKLVNIEARGKLEKLLPELIAKNHGV